MTLKNLSKLVYSSCKIENIACEPVYYYGFGVYWYDSKKQVLNENGDIAVAGHLAFYDIEKQRFNYFFRETKYYNVMRILLRKLNNDVEC